VWWVWLAPSIAVVGGLLAVAAGVVELWRGGKRLRRRVEALSADTARLQEALADVSRAAERLRDR
jgi:hypothetical protein